MSEWKPEVGPEAFLRELDPGNIYSLTAQALPGYALLVGNLPTRRSQILLYPGDTLTLPEMNHVHMVRVTSSRIECIEGCSGHEKTHVNEERAR